MVFFFGRAVGRSGMRAGGLAGRLVGDFLLFCSCDGFVFSGALKWRMGWVARQLDFLPFWFCEIKGYTCTDGHCALLLYLPLVPFSSPFCPFFPLAGTFSSPFIQVVSSAWLLFWTWRDGQDPMEFIDRGGGFQAWWCIHDDRLIRIFVSGGRFHRWHH